MPEQGLTGEAKVHETYNDSSADLTLISNDNVLFHVESFYLRANSSVFRNMMSGPPTPDSKSKPIPIDASADHLRVFLDHLRGVDIRHKALKDGHSVEEGPTFDLVEALFRLCRTFDCPVHRDSLIRQVSSCMRHTRQPWRLFCLAADIDDVPLARMAIGRMSWMLDPDDYDGWCTQEIHLKEAEKCKSLSYLVGFLRVAGSHCQGPKDVIMDEHEHLYDWDSAGRAFSPA